MPPVSVLIKPASSACNMNCKYCFYKDEASVRSTAFNGMMSLETAEKIIKSAAEYADRQCSFLFQGGEPTLSGLDFYRGFLALEKKYAKNGLKFFNSIQTNGYVIDGEWAEFFKKNKFLVGLSLDGAADIHNLNRVDCDGKGTFNRIMKTVDILNRYGVEYNILSVVTGKNARSVEKTYNFLTNKGFKYLQFIPCLEPIESDRGSEVYSLSPKEYADFLVNIFNLWLRDLKNGKYTSIRHIDNQLAIMLGRPPEMCSAFGHCSVQFVVEGDGRVYPCDFYVLDGYELGKIGENTFGEMAKSDAAINFVKASQNIPDECRACPFYCVCRNGCRRDRMVEKDGEIGKNYYCDSFKYYYAKCNAGFSEALALLTK